MSNKKSIFRALGYLCSGTAFAFLGLIAYQVLFPAAPSNAATSGTATAEVNVEVEPTLEIALDTTELDLRASDESEILPNASGVLATGTVNVYVTTNEKNGYRLKVYSNSASDEMKHINTNVNASISATAGGLTTLAGDTWGFKYGSATTWTAVGTDPDANSGYITDGDATTSICSDLSNPTDCPVGSVNTHTVTFGANVTDALPSGRYTNDVVFSVIADPSS